MFRAERSEIDGEAHGDADAATNDAKYQIVVAAAEAGEQRETVDCGAGTTTTTTPRDASTRTKERTSAVARDG